MSRLALPVRVTSLLLVAFPAAASTFTVNVATVDDVDVNPGNNVCATSTGTCTLRAAVMEANMHAGADTVSVPSGTYTFTLTGSGGASQGDLDIVGDTTIVGSTSGGNITTFIDADDIDRVFDIGALGALTVDISDVQLIDGNASGHGGAIRASNTTLTMTHVEIWSSATSGEGGALHATGSTVDLEHVNFDHNQSTGSGGGIYVSGGDLTIYNSIVSENHSSSQFGGGIFFNGQGSYTLGVDLTAVDHNDTYLGGGGIYLQDGNASILDSEIKNNLANNGGGLLIYGSASSPVVEIDDTSFYRNTVVVNGGGLEVGDATVLMVNSTLAENLARGSGGGLFSVNTATVFLNSVTMAYNHADSDASGAGSGGAIYAGGGTYLLRHTLLALNVRDTTVSPFTTADNCSGTIASDGYNLTDSTAGCTVSSGSAFIVNTSPGTNAIASNGGPTQTVALSAGSPAINTGDASSPYCDDSFGVTLSADQRGSSRIAGGTCDIGAYEY